ncbi:hypothetical protein FRC00_001752 [Tulasnella sp. 408]|nr:hypothetical protein FRC00_001752 [Tulasnella sp. 408]
MVTELTPGRVFRALFGQYPPGKRPNPDEVRQRLAAAGSRTVSGSSTQSARPAKRELTMEFFSSEYFKWFQMQFPILDPAEFIERYENFVNRGVSLGICGELIAKTLLAWATSYGFDESGADVVFFHDEGVKAEDDDALATMEKRKAATNTMVRELLDAVDKHAVARTTTWDGVRVLLLLLPLTEDVLPAGDRVNLYRSTLNQVYSLSGLDSGYEKLPSVDGSVKETVRDRVIWHAIIDEGISSALNGTKLIFDQDDAIAFEPSLTSETYNAALQSCPVTAHLNSNFTFVPCRLASVCRLISEYLTSPKAERLAACGKEDITQHRLELIWSALEESLKEFDSLRGNWEFADSLEDELRETFVSKWQIFIYGVYNTIREKLWTRISQISDSLGSRNSARMRNMMNLHDMAESRCNALVARTLDAVRRHTESSFFELDAGLFEPGIVFAAEHFTNNADSLEEFQCCIDALQRMRWALPSPTFHSPSSDIIRTPATYGPPIINSGRLESPLHPHIIAPLGQLSGHGSYLDQVAPLTQHSLPEAHEMGSTHSSVSSSSLYLQPSLEAPLNQCDQSLDVLQFLNASGLVSYTTSHSASAFSL